jgi:tetratricopeptide (TPR) repeat protein
MATLGCMISAGGDHRRGVALANRANAINSDASIGWYHSTVYTALYLAGDYPRALEIAKEGVQDMFYVYLEVIPIYGRLGLKPEAAEAWRSMQRLYPGATAQSFVDWWRLWNIKEDEVTRLMDGVYQSGIFGRDSKPG